jgi:hypothetical protein
MTNKTQEVLKHLQTKNQITSMEAIDLYDATRLSSIIFNLKKKGYHIITQREECIDRYGNTCRFGRYIYLGKEQRPDFDFFGLGYVNYFGKLFRRWFR